MLTNKRKGNTEMRMLLYFVILLFLTGTMACDDDFSPFVTEIEVNSIADFLLKNESEYGYFIKLAERGALMDALNSYNPHGNSYTLFLPGNEAFEKFFARSSSYNNLDDVLDDLDFTRALVRFHVLNMAIHSSDFPFGALPSQTLSGNILTVGFSPGADSITYMINNVAPIKRRNIQARNGFIHVLDEVLEPVVLSSFEWLKLNPEYSILTGVFEITNMKDRMGPVIENSAGEQVANNYTLWAEADSIFHKKGIRTLNELIEVVSPNNSNFTDEDNPLYQFAAYHIMEGVYFLDAFEGTRNYNTFGSFPIRITAAARLRINNDPNFHVFDTIVTGTDTTYINFLEPIYNSSNLLTVNGAIHFLNNVLFTYRPRPATLRFEFFEDPVINSLRNISNTHIFTRQTPLTYISWEGPEQIIYYKAIPGATERAENRDYIRIDGDFALYYKVPRILPGRYQVMLRAHSNNANNAIVEVLINGRRIGGNVNLTSGATGGQPYRIVSLGSVEFNDYEAHMVTVRSVLPGIFTWDYIEFIPN
jgi:uncharacterized surface protein with fasciclin (FAS1) repeats